VSGKVFGCGADGHGRFKDLQPDLGPLADGLELHAAVDERLCEVAAPRAERVRADGDGSRGLVGLEEGQSLYH
jgi:hypothetical protein